MLEDTLEVRETFEHLIEMDSGYKSLSTKKEWERKKRICKHLKLFYDIKIQFQILNI